MKQFYCMTAGNEMYPSGQSKVRNPFSLKKIFLFVVVMVLIPPVTAAVFGLFSDRVRMGGGDRFLGNRRMGKEILVEQSGLYKSMDVEEFVAGVLPGTIPADYERETLKLQAVLIRTNVLKEMQEKNTSDAADLSYHYLTVEERKELWGERNFAKYERRMEEAVARTAGQVLKQGGELITACYHEVSVGQTASAEEILGTDISYLQSVDSSRDVEAKHYMNLVTYSWQELRGRLRRAEGEDAENKEADGVAAGAEEQAGANAGGGTGTGTETGADAGIVAEERAGADAGGGTGTGEGAVAEEQVGADAGGGAGTGGGAVAEEQAGADAGGGTGADAGTGTDATAGTTSAGQEEPVTIQIEESTEHGYVKRISIDGKTYSGEEAMELLGLCSTNFYVEETGDGIRLICLGKGSGLGVSQFGANCMAQDGKKLQEILDHYYQGVSLAEAASSF